MLNLISKVAISLRFPQYTIPKKLKSALILMSREKHPITNAFESTMLIYRRLIKKLFDQEVLCRSNAEILKLNQPILSACKGLNDFSFEL